MRNIFFVAFLALLTFSSCALEPPPPTKNQIKLKRADIAKRDEIAHEYNKYLSSQITLDKATKNVAQNLDNNGFKTEEDKRLEELIASAPVLEMDDRNTSHLSFVTTNLAILTPMTGQNKKIGKEMVDTAVLSLDLLETNKINITYIDTQSTEEGLKQAILKVKQGSFDAVIGPIFSNETAIVLKAAKDQDLNIPILSLSNDKNLVDKNLVLFGYSQEDSMRDLASIFANAKRFNFSTLFQGSLSGSTDFKIFKSVCKDYNVNILHSEFYDTSGLVGIQKYISRILNDLVRVKIFDKKTGKELDRNHVAFNEKFHSKKTVTIDAIYLNGYGGELRKMLSSIDDQSKIVKESTIIVVNPAAAEDSIQINPYLAGVYFIGNPAYYNYLDSFYQKFSYKPSKISSILYDAIIFAATAKGDNEYINLSQLQTSKKTFDGINGTFELNGNSVRRFGRLMRFKPSGAYESVNLDSVVKTENLDYDLNNILQKE